MTYNTQVLKSSKHGIDIYTAVVHSMSGHRLGHTSAFSEAGAQQAARELIRKYNTTPRTKPNLEVGPELNYAEIRVQARKLDLYHARKFGKVKYV